jgi:hypothetical protein
MAAAPGPLESVLGGGGNSFRNETASNARATGSSDLNGTFGANWSVATGGSKAGQSGLDADSLLILAGAAVVAFLIWKRK